MKPPIVILHGWGASSQSFKAVSQYLKERGFAVYAIDLPGFGRVLPPPQPWSVDNYVSFVLKFAESEKLNKFYLLGHSFGGRIGIKLAAAHPEKLEGLILVDAAGVTPKAKLKIEILFKAVAKLGNWAFSLPILKYFHKTARKIFYFLLRAKGVSDYYLLENEVMKRTFERVIGENLFSYLSRIKTPTLIIWGGKDKITPLSDAYIIKKNILHSQLKILDNVGHSPHREAPEVLARLISEFVFGRQ